VEVSFWKRIAPKLAVAVGEVVFTLLDGRREMVWLALLLVVVGAAVDVVVGVSVVLGGGAGEYVDGAGAGAAALEESWVPDPASELPLSKTTTLAVPPEGIVTTQKAAPPAPSAWSALVTPPMPLTEGSMEHGVPLQPDPAHTIFRPKFGITWEKSSMYFGFHPIL
jgi:hypothetical protein